MLDLLKYNTLIFDCDGVILNSNNIKSKAFYDVALPYGVKAAEELYTYHIKNNGISVLNSSATQLHGVTHMQAPKKNERADHYITKVGAKSICRERCHQPSSTAKNQLNSTIGQNTALCEIDQIKSRSHQWDHQYQ